MQIRFPLDIVHVCTKEATNEEGRLSAPSRMK